MSVFSDRALAAYNGTSSRSSPALSVLSPPSNPFIGFGGVLRVLVIVALLIFFASVVGVLSNGTPKTFADFLTMLQTFPTVSTDWLNFVEISLNLPDWLSWLQSLIDFINGFVSVLGFLITGIIQAIAFVLHFLQWVFI